MTLKLNGTNSVAAPAYAGDDADTGLQCGTNELKLVTGGTARATVDSSGNVGIGTTSPTLSNNSTGIHIHGSGSGGSRLHLTDSNTGTAKSDGTEIVVSGSDLYIDQKENASTIFYTNGSERARILSSGGITFNGDTAAANALDDYEEGTWTAQLKAGTHLEDPISTDANLTSSYVKIGSTVYFFFYERWNLSNIPSTWTDTRILLPFISADFRPVTISYWSSFYDTGTNSAFQPAGYIGKSQQYLKLTLQAITQSGESNVGSSEMQTTNTSAGLMISGMYTAA